MVDGLKIAKRGLALLTVLALVSVGFTGTVSAKHWPGCGPLLVDWGCTHVHCNDPPWCNSKTYYHCWVYKRGPGGHVGGPCYHA